MNQYISNSRVTFLKSPLLKNSFFMMLYSISSAGFGFVFWTLAAKFYSPLDVGIATALLSSMNLIVLFSRFGLDYSIIRFFPEYDKNSIFNTSWIVTTFFAVVFGILFIIGIDVLSPNLNFLKSPSNACTYLIFLSANSFAILAGISFVALRKAGLQFIQSLFVSTRILFLLPFIKLKAIGIFDAIGASFIVASIFSIIYLALFGIKLNFKIDKTFLNEAFNFSVGNYLAVWFTTAPNYILPLLVLNILGVEETAYYYIAFSIASLLFMIPGSISMSLLVEGSYGKELKKMIIKSFSIVFSIIIPALVILYFESDWFLNIFGKTYSENGGDLLKIMIFTSIFMTITSIYITIKRIQKDVNEIVILSGIIFLILIGSSYIFMLKFGLIGIGYAWVLSYGIGTVITGVLVWKNKWI